MTTHGRERKGQPPDESVALAPTQRPHSNEDGFETAQLRAQLTSSLFGLESEPVRIGRYTVLRRIGSGGMGVVYAAYDEDLDRRVAIKLVRGASSSDDSDASARLRREAQALARLSHPNVIAVHEVGEHVADGARGDEPFVFIAMEFVHGKTLRAWWSEQARPWRVVLDAVLQAGRGLAAVHDAGLVHRDVKPENILVGDDGRVRLMDFGLALTEIDERRASLDEQRSSDQLVTPALTRSGELVGTPAYMAPEQFEGSAVGPRADQFALCVTTWEALYGERPFAGKTLHELIEAVTSGRPCEPKLHRSVPTFVRRALERGLAPKLEHRWPHVHELLEGLARDPNRSWRIVGAISLLGAAAALAIAGREPGLDCHDRDLVLGSAWDDTARAAVRASVLGTQVSFAQDTWVRVEAGLDAYVDRWMAVQVQACEGNDAQITGDLRTAQARCIAERKRAVGALVEVLSVADAVVVEKAVESVAGLPAVARCTDIEVLAAKVKPPDDEEVAAQVEVLRDRLGRATALAEAGAYAEGGAVAQEVVVAARELGYGPLLAEALLRRGTLARDEGHYEESDTNLRASYAEALASGDDELAAEAATQLVSVVGSRLAKPEGGLEWGAHAMAELRRVGLGDEREAALLNNLGLVEDHRGKHDVALAHYQRALAIKEEVFGPDDTRVANTLVNLCGVHEKRGEFDEALADGQRALAIFETALGPAHPEVGAALNGIGMVYSSRGDYDEAIDYLGRAVALKEQALGPEHVSVASSLNNLGNAQRKRGDLDAALASYLRALSIREKALGEDHPSVGNALNGLGNLYQVRGDDDEALATFVRALAIKEKSLGPEHPSVGSTLSNLAIVFMKRGELEQALTHLRRSLAIQEKAHGPGHRLVGDVLQNMGHAESKRGRYDAAVAAFERALKIRTSTDVPREDLADTRSALGRALWQVGRDRKRALELVEQSREVFRAAPGRKDELADLEAWLRELDASEIRAARSALSR